MKNMKKCVLLNWITKKFNNNEKRTRWCRWQWLALNIEIISIENRKQNRFIYVSHLTGRRKKSLVKKKYEEHWQFKCLKKKEIMGSSIHFTTFACHFVHHLIIKSTEFFFVPAVFSSLCFFLYHLMCENLTINRSFNSCANAFVTSKKRTKQNEMIEKKIQINCEFYSLLLRFVTCFSFAFVSRHFSMQWECC